MYLITKLDPPVHAGDWHDKPLKWQVHGPEKQNFSTKKDAIIWAGLRARMSFNEAGREFMRATMKEITE